MPVAWVWQDLIVILLFALGQRVLRIQWIWWTAYWLLALLTAVNTPVALDMGSPLTVSMLRAARGTLADSITHHVTPFNLALTGGILLAAALVPLIWRRLARRTAVVVRAPTLVLATALIAVALAGSATAARVDTRGMERNPVFAIAGTLAPRVRGVAGNDTWRESLAPRRGGDNMPASADELRALRGSLPGKNVLLVVLESAGARYLAPFGSAEDVMPNLSGLSRRSLVFENTYAVYPESVRGIVSYLASRYPGFDIQNGEHARIASPSLATELSRAGYRTALFHSGRFIYLGMDEILAASGFHVLEDAGDIGGNHSSSFGVDEPAAVARILVWLDSLPAGTRFFAAWLPVEGHHPYTFTPPAPFPAGDDFGNYRNALFDADRALGVLLDGLRRRGLDSNTIVAVTSDHAEAFGQHPGNFGHTLALYEENIRVPLVIALPQGETREMRLAETASLLDIAPTILDLLGLQRPQQFQGSSLLDGREQMALFFTDYSLGLLGARDGCVKFVYEMESRRSRMFDLCQDPDETTDISARQPALAAAYRDRLTRWIAAQVENVRG